MELDNTQTNKQTKHVMKQLLDRLTESTMNLIKTFATMGDAHNIAKLAETANRIQNMKEQLAQIENEAQMIEETLKSYTSNPSQQDHTSVPQVVLGPVFGPSKKKQKKLRITTDWSRLGRTGGREIICEHKSSDTITKWAARCYQQIGIGFLDKLASHRVSRGPMVSRTPQSDYLNRTDGSIYNHQPVADSGYYILTHSSTSQKIADISTACRCVLEFPIGAVMVEDVS